MNWFDLSDLDALFAPPEPEPPRPVLVWTAEGYTALVSAHEAEGLERVGI
jgi:hypothetical protein